MKKQTQKGEIKMKEHTTVICSKCKRRFRLNQTVKVIGSKRRICRECLSNLSCYTLNNKMVNKPTKKGTTYGFELECVPKTPQHKAYIINTLTDLIATDDGSLPSGGVEFKTPIYNSLRGVKQMLETMCEHADFSNQKCGQHINIGNNPYINEYSINIIKKFAPSLFDDLYNYMYEHKEETVKVCGRFFNGYVTRDYGYSDHYSWISLSHDNRIEFRISKLRTVEQYLILTKMWEEMLSCVINDLIKPYNLHIPRTERTKVKNVIIEGEARNISVKLIKIFNKYVKIISNN